MPILAKASSGTDYKPAPEGQHQAVCCDVIDLGVMESTWQGKVNKRHKIRIVFQIGELRDDEKPHTVSQMFTLSLDERGKLRPFLESWRGKKFAEAELVDGFDVERLIGANAIVQVVHNRREDKVFANINSIMAPLKGMEKMAVSGGYVRVQDREPEQAQQAPPPDERGYPDSWDELDNSLPF